MSELSPHTLATPANATAGDI